MIGDAARGAIGAEDDTSGARTIARRRYDPIDAAAAKLGLDVEALRARCRRAARRQGTAIVADLGGGIEAFKFGRSWRVKFPE